LDAIDIPKQVIEIVKDFEKTGKGYIA